MPELLIETYPPPGDPEPRAYDGKFVQLSWRGQDYLVLAARERYRYHNQILARFMSEHGIAYRWTTGAVLEVQATDLNVRGGGRFMLDLEAGRFDLWDNSQAYGRFDERRLAATIAGAGEPWSRLAIRIT
jgi:Janus/Ocnus family (Ocnus)